MKLLAATVMSLSLMAPLSAHAEQRGAMSNATTLRPEDVRKVAPALENYTRHALFGDVWKRPALLPRDRSIVTLAAPIARDQTIEVAHYLNLALDSGVKPGEVSEITTHLAFHSGWANAMSVSAVAKDVFARRSVEAGQLIFHRVTGAWSRSAP